MATPNEITLYIDEEKKKKLLELGYDYDAMSQMEIDSVWGQQPIEVTDPLIVPNIEQALEDKRVATARKDSIRAGYSAERAALKAVYLQLVQDNPKPYEAAEEWRTQIEMTGEMVDADRFYEKVNELYGNKFLIAMDNKRKQSQLVYPAGFDERAIQTAAEPQEVRQKRKANVLPTTIGRELFELTQPNVSVGTFRGDKKTGVELNRVAARKAQAELVSTGDWTEEEIKEEFAELNRQLANPRKFLKTGVSGIGGTDQPIGKTTGGRVETARVPFLTDRQLQLLGSYHRAFAIDNPDIVTPLVWWADEEEVNKRKAEGVFGEESVGTRRTLRDVPETVTALVSGRQPEEVEMRVYPGAVSYFDVTQLGAVETELGSTVETPVTGIMRYLNLPENLFFGALGQVLAEGAEAAGFEGWQEQRRTSAIQPTNVSGGDNFAEDVVISALANADGFRGGAEETYDLVAASQNTSYYRAAEDIVIASAENIADGTGTIVDSLITSAVRLVANPFDLAAEDANVSLDRIQNPDDYVAEDLAAIRSRTRLVGWVGGFVGDLAASTAFWTAIGSLPGAVVGAGSIIADTGKINRAMKVLLASTEAGSVAPQVKVVDAANAVVNENYVPVLARNAIEFAASTGRRGEASTKVAAQGEDLRNVATKVLADGIETNRAASKTATGPTKPPTLTLPEKPSQLLFELKPEWNITEKLIDDIVKQAEETMLVSKKTWQEALEEAAISQVRAAHKRAEDAADTRMGKVTFGDKTQAPQHVDGLFGKGFDDPDFYEPPIRAIEDWWSELGKQVTKRVADAKKPKPKEVLVGNTPDERIVIQASETANRIIDDIQKAPLTTSAKPADKQRWLQTLTTNPDISERLISPSKTAADAWQRVTGDAEGMKALAKVIIQDEAGKAIAKITKDNPVFSQGTIMLTPRTMVGSQKKADEVIALAETTDTGRLIKEINAQSLAGDLPVIGIVDDVSGSLTHGIEVTAAQMKLIKENLRKLYQSQGEARRPGRNFMEQTADGQTGYLPIRSEGNLADTFVRDIQAGVSPTSNEAGKILAMIDGAEKAGKPNVIPTIALRKMADMNIDAAARSVSPMTRQALAKAGAPAALDILPQNMAPSRWRKWVLDYNKRQLMTASPEPITEMSVAAQTARKAMEQEISVLGDIVVRRVGHIMNRKDVRAAYGIEEGEKLTNTQAIMFLLGGTKNQDASVRQDRVKLALDNIIDVLAGPKKAAKGETSLFGRFSWGADADINALERMRVGIDTDAYAQKFISSLDEGTGAGVDKAINEVIIDIYNKLKEAHKGEEELVSLLTEEKLMDAVLASMVEAEKTIIVRKHLSELEDVVGVSAAITEGVASMNWHFRFRNGAQRQMIEKDWFNAGLSSPQEVYEKIYSNALAQEIMNRTNGTMMDPVDAAVDAVFGSGRADSAGFGTDVETIRRQTKLFRDVFETQALFKSKLETTAQAIIKNNNLEAIGRRKGGVDEIIDVVDSLRSGKAQDRLEAIVGVDRTNIMKEALGGGHDTSKITKFATDLHRKQNARGWRKGFNYLGNALKAFQAFRYNIILGMRSRFHGNNQATAAAINLQTLGAGATGRSIKELNVAAEIVAMGSTANRTKTTQVIADAANGGWQEKIAVVSKDGKLYTYGDVFRLAEEGGGLRSQSGFVLSDGLMNDIKTRTINRDRNLFGSSRSLQAGYTEINPTGGQAFINGLRTGEFGQMPVVGGLFRQNVLSGLADDEDKIWRIANTMAELRRGGGENAAKAAGRRSLMDYGSLLDFEKQHIQKVTLFWSFQSLSWKTYFKAATEHPERMAQAVQFATNGIPFFTSPEEAKAQLSPYRPAYLMPRPIIGVMEGLDKENYFQVSPTIPILDKLVDIAPFITPVIQKAGAAAVGVEGSRSYKEDLANAFVSAFVNNLQEGFAPEIKMLVGKEEDMLAMIETGWIDPRDYFLLSNKTMDDGSTGWDAFSQLIGEPSFRPARKGETSWNGLVPYFEDEEKINDYLAIKKSIGIIGAQTILYDYAPLMGQDQQPLLERGRRLTTSFPELLGLSTDVAKTDEFRAREAAADRKKAQQKTEIIK